MDRRMLVRIFQSRPVFGVIGLVIGVLLSISGSSYAFQFEHGELKGSLDTTLSFGASWRVEDQDSDIIGTANGGTAYSVNGDDGNLNYDKGLVSSVAKMTSELELSYQNFGGFFRGTAFYDIENERSSRERTKLTSEALDLVGSDVELLDAYIWASFDIGNMPVQLRVGEQVVSWGESTFIQSGINAINPVNVSAIRLPGSELREALLPEGMVWMSIGITENITFEGLYLYDWEETIIDPPGSYWSSNDFAGEGGNKVMLGWGDVPDFGLLSPYFTPLAVPRGSTGKADDQGQFGLACRIFSPTLNDSEFGFYFLRYHSRLPVISSTTGYPAPDLNSYLKTANYRTEYPEYINMYGVSFNTMLGNIGTALQGEVSFREDMPLQVDDIELLYATMGVNPLDPASVAMALLNQVGSYLLRFGTDIPGYILRDVSQAQATATHFFGPSLGADQILVLGEVGITHVHNMPSKGELRLDGAGTYVSGNPILGLGTHPGKPIESSRHFADATSWGYRLVCRLDFNNLIGAVNVKPRVAWRHDVNGNSPRPAGNFLENRKAISFGVGADYQNSWNFDISYTNYFGAGRYNLINDRDIISANIKYSF